MFDLSSFILTENILENPQIAYGHFAVSEDGCLGVIDGHRKLDNQIVFLGCKIDISPSSNDLWLSLLPKVFTFVVSPERISDLADDLLPPEEDTEPMQLSMLPPGLAQMLMARQIGNDNQPVRAPIPGMLPAITTSEAEEEKDEFPLSLILRLLPSGDADIQLQCNIPEEELSDDLKEFIEYVTNWVQSMNSSEDLEDDSPDLDDIIGPDTMR